MLLGHNPYYSINEAWSSNRTNDANAKKGFTPPAGKRIYPFPENSFRFRHVEPDRGKFGGECLGANPSALKKKKTPPKNRPLISILMIDSGMRSGVSVKGSARIPDTSSFKRHI